MSFNAVSALPGFSGEAVERSGHSCLLRVYLRGQSEALSALVGRRQLVDRRAKARQRSPDRDWRSDPEDIELKWVGRAIRNRWLAFRKCLFHITMERRLLKHLDAADVLVRVMTSSVKGRVLLALRHAHYVSPYLEVGQTP